MAYDPVAARYAEALFAAVQDAGETDKALEEMRLIGELLRASPDLRRLIRNPDVEADEKAGVLERALKGSWSGTVRSFVEMTMSMGRGETLSEIVEAFQAVVDAHQGLVRVLVRSVHPLAAERLAKLQERLEALERKTIQLRTEIAPELLGGLQIRLGHRVIDGSIRRQLSELRQRLLAVRVN